MQSWMKSANSLASLMILVLTIMIALVGYGWWLLFQKPIQNSFLALLVAAALTIMALLIARFLGQLRSDKKLNDKASFRWYSGGPAYIFLFAISALGTINAAFALFEGPAIVRQDMSSIRTAYNQLSIAANRELRLPSFDRKTTNLEALLTNLHEEIVNPNGGNYCGVGPAAEEILSRIHEIVPDMPRIRGTGAIKPCNLTTANRVYQSYADSARATLQRDGEYVAFKGPEKMEFLSRLSKNLVAMESDFAVIENLLGDVTAVSRPSVQRPLAKAASSYAADQAIYVDLIKPAQSNLPDKIDITASQELGSIAAVFQIAAKRMVNFRTWIYIFIAFLIDIGVVLLFTQIFIRQASLGETSAKDPYRDRGPRPRFIWVNPVVDPERRTIRHV